MEKSTPVSLENDTAARPMDILNSRRFETSNDFKRYVFALI
jgi:hypothetical protein